MFRNKMASQHSFAMVPSADIPRSKYLQQQRVMTTFDAGDLVPIYAEEMLPGDHFSARTEIYCRLATPIVPVLDNAELETFTFAVPYRILWDNWDEFITGGNFTIPQISGYVGDAVAIQPGSIFGQMGIPSTGQISGSTMTFSALPFRALNKIFNEWFRDENLVTALTENTGNGPDASTDYVMQKRMKQPDYFTKALPWPQKGTAVSLPLSGSANVIGGLANGTLTNAPQTYIGGGGGDFTVVVPAAGTLTGSPGPSTTVPFGFKVGANIGAYADLSTATGATINALRLSFQVQRLLERDARGGTRLVETLQAHFGVRPPDYRLQRPEYIGGGRTHVTTSPIAQTSGTGASGQTTPLGNLAAFSTVHGGAHRWKYAAVEHCIIITLANVRTQLSYQQGLRKFWKRSTRYDFYWPVFAHLGEQTVTLGEIYWKDDAQATTVFGYQERWAEYRYTPNMINGLFRSTETGTIDIWHYAEKFASTPSLNSAFVTSTSKTVMGRSMAVGTSSYGQQILFDCLHSVETTRPMPTYSVPGLIDHF